MKKTNLIFSLARASTFAFLFAAAIPVQADVSEDLDSFYSYFDNTSGLMRYQHNSSPRILGEEGVYFELGVDSSFQKPPELRMYMQMLTSKPMKVDFYTFRTDGREPIFPPLRWSASERLRNGKYVTWHNPNILQKREVQLLLKSTKVSLEVYGNLIGGRNPYTHRIELTGNQLEAMRSVYAAWEELDLMHKDIKTLRQ